jgi:multiple sugar transport system substrate-binding protein
MWMGQSFAEFAVRGVFLDLSDRIAEDVDLDEYLPQALSWYRIDGKQYGIPFGVDMNFIAYNKDLFDEAGVTYPTDDWTFDEFLEKARALTRDRDGDGAIDQYGFKGNLEKASFGAAVINDAGTKPLCNSPEMIEYLTVNMALSDKWHVSPRPDDSDSQSLDAYSYFRQGKAAMMMMYTWNLPFLRSRCGDIDWDIVNNPTVHQRGHWASSQAILISSDTPHPDEAWLLCKRFFGEEIQRTMGQRGLPSNLRIARELIAENAREGGVPANLAALLKATDSLYPTPRIANLSEIMSLYYESAGGVTAHRTTPEKAMAKAEKAIHLYLKRRRRLED